MDCEDSFYWCLCMFDEQWYQFCMLVMCLYDVKVMYFGYVVGNVCSGLVECCKVQCVVVIWLVVVVEVRIVGLCEQCWGVEQQYWDVLCVYVVVQQVGVVVWQVGLFVYGVCVL